MSEEQQGVWLDENTYVEADGTTHKAVPMGKSCNCSLLKMCNTVYIPCRPEDRSDGKHVMFAIVQKIEVAKCKPHQVATTMNDRICQKCAIKLGATMRDGTVQTMSFEKCARCGEHSLVVRAVKWGVAYEGKPCEVKA